MQEQRASPARRTCCLQLARGRCAGHVLTSLVWPVARPQVHGGRL